MTKNNPKCILHAGMPKTGTTSIQQYLWDNADSSDHFVYVCQYGIDSAFDLVHWVHSRPTTYVEYTIGNLNPEKLTDYKAQTEDYINQKINVALEKNKTLLFSWEGCFSFFSTDELLLFRNRLESRGFTVEVIIYVRNWKDFIQSVFQQRIKGLRLDTFIPVPPNLNQGLKERIIPIEEAFGAHAVRVFKYDTALFENGDVVGHFCQQTELPYKAARLYRQNDSLSLPAIKFLYAYNRYGPMRGYGPAIKNNYLLIGALAALEGPPLRFHSSVLDSMADLIAQERPWLEQKMGGVSMAEDICKDDNEEHTIKSESDMFNFSPDSLNWLAAQINARPVTPVSGERAAQKVAVQVHTLFKKIHGPKPLYYRLIRKAKTVTKHIIMKFIPTVIAIIACFSSANAQFPETWQGDWTGSLDIFNGSGKVQSVEMTVEIHKIDTSTQGRYTFGLVYGSRDKDWRPYELVPVSPETGIWKVDEKNAIMMESFLMGPKFLCWFVVQRSRVLCTYEKVDDSTMIFEVMSGLEASISTTGNTVVGGENIPEVQTYPFSVFQRAVLHRK
ncbi:MAG: hypothetical protein ACKOCO_13605 [Bacteroidota bacterium]